MTNKFYTKKENDLIKGMDDLLSTKTALSTYWENSITESTIKCYKNGSVKDV